MLIDDGLSADVIIVKNRRNIGIVKCVGCPLANHQYYMKMKYEICDTFHLLNQYHKQDKYEITSLLLNTKYNTKYDNDNQFESETDQTLLNIQYQIISFRTKHLFFIICTRKNVGNRMYMHASTTGYDDKNVSSV